MDGPMEGRREGRRDGSSFVSAAESLQIVKREERLTTCDRKPEVRPDTKGPDKGY